MKVQKKVATVARKTRVVKPSLTLTADVPEVKAGRTIALKVEFKGADKVELQLEPRGTFEMDLSEMKKPGLVRLKGRKDGKGTVIATAHVKGGVIRRMIHLACEGPVVRILGFGYLPKE
jgi:hypothetical protein